MSIIKLPTMKNAIILGSVNDAFDSSIEEKYNPVYINVAEELNLLERANGKSFKFGMEDDDPRENITRHFPGILHLIDGLLQESNVMIHCLEGKSRSVCVTLAYLVLFHEKTFDEMYSIVLGIRPEIDIYPAYVEQLKAWECTIHFPVTPGNL